MSRKGEYSDKYGFHVSNLEFNCGGESIAMSAHGALSTAGIEGAQPRKYTTERTHPHPEPTAEYGSAGVSRRRAPAEPRNPLNPSYKLPQAAVQAPEELKFIRDTLDVTDIEGAKKKPYKSLDKAFTSLNTADIDGGSASKVPPARQAGTRTAALDVSDINGSGGKSGAGAASRPAGARRVASPGVKQVEEGIGEQTNLEWWVFKMKGLQDLGLLFLSLPRLSFTCCLSHTNFSPPMQAAKAL